MPDGKITKDDLVDSNAVKVYTELSKNAVTAIDIIIKKLGELSAAQGRVSQSDEIKLASQLAINKALKEGQEKLDTYKLTLDKLTEAKKRKGTADKQDISAFQELKKVTREADDAVKSTIITEGKKTDATNKSIEATKELKTQIRNLNNETKLKTDSFNKSTKAIQTDYSETTKLSNAISLQKQKVSELTLARKKNDPELRKAIAHLRELQNTQKGVNQNTKQSTSSTNSFGASLKNLLKSIVAFIGIRMFFQFIKDTFELTKKLDSLKFSMSAILKSNEYISKSTSFLNRITEAYGASIVKTTESYIRFVAAAQQSKVPLRDAQKIFETFTKVSGVLGLNSQSLSEIFLALEQMLSKGKITTEELRRQLGEKLPGAFGIMATTLGVSTTALDKMLRKGEVLSGEVLPKFAEQVEIAFGLNSVDRINTLQASATRLSNAWVEVFNEFKNGTGLVSKLSAVIDFLTRNLKTSIELVVIGAVAFVSFKTAVAIATVGMNGFRTALQIAKGEIVAFSVALKANIIGAGIVAIELLVSLFYSLKESTSLTTQELKEASDAFAENASKTKDSINRTNELIDTYDNLSKKVGENYTAQVLINKQIQDNNKYIEILNKKIKDGADVNGEYAEKLRLTKNENIELAEKTSLYKDEQIQLNTITRTLSKTFPLAKKEVNDYGDAVIVATDELRKFNLEKEKELALSLKVNNDKIYKDLETLRKKDYELYKDYIKKKKELEAPVTGQALTGNKEENDALLKQIDINNQKQLDALENTFNENKRINDEKKQNALDALKENNKTLFLLTDEGKALEKVRLEQEALDKKKKADAKTHNNLQEEYNKLLEEGRNIEISNEKFIEENGIISKKTKAERLDEIGARMKDIKSEMDAINKRLGLNTSSGGKGSETAKKQPKEFEDLTGSINRGRLQSEIDTNNAIIESDKTLYSEKVRLAEQNEANLIKINLSEYTDVITKNENERRDRIAKAKDTGESELDINKHYDDLNILAEQNYRKKENDIYLDAEKIKDEIATKEVANNKQALETKLSDIKLALDSQLEANQNAFDRGEITRRQFQKANKDAYDTAEKEGTDAINAVFDKLIKILEDAGLATDGLREAFNKAIQAFTGMGRGFETGISSTEKMVIALDVLGQALGKIGNISRNASDARINDIEREITAEEEKYARLKELAGDNVSTKQALDIELAAHIKVLKEKERKEKEKQWKIDKKIALAEAAINIAVAITNAAKKGFWNIAPIIALGALEIGVIASQKMPQFAKGGKMAYDGKALINDAGKKEFVERKGFIYTTNYENAVVDLQKGDIIHKDYDALMNARIMKSIAYNGVGVNGNKIDSRDLRNIEGSIKKGFNGVKNVINLSTQKIDIPQALYKQSKIKWA